MNKPKEDAILWRYLAFERFVDLLITQELHFGRLDQFNDHFEGMWPAPYVSIVVSSSVFG